MPSHHLGREDQINGDRLALYVAEVEAVFCQIVGDFRIVERFGLDFRRRGDRLDFLVPVGELRRLVAQPRDVGFHHFQRELRQSDAFKIVARMGRVACLAKQFADARDRRNLAKAALRRRHT